MTIPVGKATEWMTHPVQGYVYVLEGTLTVEYAEGFRKEFKAGHGFAQGRSKWHRGRNDGDTIVRFLAVFFGGKGAECPEPAENPNRRLPWSRDRQRPRTASAEGALPVRRDGTLTLRSQRVAAARIGLGLILLSQFTHALLQFIELLHFTIREGSG